MKILIKKFCQVNKHLHIKEEKQINYKVEIIKNKLYLRHVQKTMKFKIMIFKLPRKGRKNKSQQSQNHNHYLQHMR